MSNNYGLCLQCGTYHVSGEKCPTPEITGLSELAWHEQATKDRAQLTADRDAWKAKAERYREELTDAIEAMAERRSYCDAWEIKYRGRWDDEDNQARAALED